MIPTLIDLIRLQQLLEFVVGTEERRLLGETSLTGDGVGLALHHFAVVHVVATPARPGLSVSPSLAPVAVHARGRLVCRAVLCHPTVLLLLLVLRRGLLRVVSSHRLMW